MASSVVSGDDHIILLLGNKTSSASASASASASSQVAANGDNNKNYNNNKNNNNSSINDSNMGPNTEANRSPADEATPLLVEVSESSKSATSIVFANGVIEEGACRRKSIGESIRDASCRFSEFILHHTGSIGMLGSVSIAVNSLTGPAMLNLPATFARSGLIPTVSCLIFVCVLAAFCSLHMSSVISKVPGNGNFKKEVEYSEAFRAFWGQGWFNFTQLIFLCCITCLNISSIVDTSQVVDTFLGQWWPRGTAALQISFEGDYHWIRWDYSLCQHDELMSGLCTPFRNVEGIMLTMGKFITAAIFLPLALMDLKENAHWQIVGFIILCVTSVQFIIQFYLFEGTETHNLTLWGDDWSDLFGVVLFNFALVIAVPAWLYEREPHVDVPTVVQGSSFLSVILYICIGVLGCMAMPDVSDNMLQSMMSGALGTGMQLGASVFAFAIIGLGIPLFSVLTRLNLTASGLCSLTVGNLLAVYLPFTVSFFLYDGTSVTKLLSWGGVIFTSLVAFILPIVLALHVVNEYEYEGTISVYGGRLKSKRAQQIALWVLLILTTISVIIALIGNFYAIV